MTTGLGPTIELTGDVRADMDVIRAFYADKSGLRPERRTEPRLREEDAAADHRLSRRGYRGRVTRIIAGRAGSLTLEVPDAGTRPTSDRVRESLFGALESADALRGAAVLDLYAGSGALGLEAVSRGAASADLVEKAPRAASVVERNAARVAKAVGRDAAIARAPHLRRSRTSTSRSGPFDLVFIDPPYDLAEAELTHALELLVPSLAPHATVIVERASRSPEPTLPPGLAPHALEALRRHDAVVDRRRGGHGSGLRCSWTSSHSAIPPLEHVGSPPLARCRSAVPHAAPACSGTRRSRHPVSAAPTPRRRTS